MYNDWTLTPDQFTFMVSNHDAIAAAYTRKDMAYLRQLAASPEFLSLFGGMRFDEAYDRYETMLDDDSA